MVKSNWDQDVDDIIHNPDKYTASQRKLAWCSYFKRKTGNSVRQISVKKAEIRKNGIKNFLEEEKEEDLRPCDTEG